MNLSQKTVKSPALNKMRYEDLRFCYGVKDPDSAGKIIQGNVRQAVSALFKDTELFAVAKGPDNERHLSYVRSEKLQPGAL